MTYTTLRYGVQKRILTLTLDRPDLLNAFTPEACPSWFLPRMVGLQTAQEWCSTAKEGVRSPGERTMKTSSLVSGKGKRR